VKSDHHHKSGWVEGGWGVCEMYTCGKWVVGQYVVVGPQAWCVCVCVHITCVWIESARSVCPICRQGSGWMDGWMDG
jgi:hypothetical protein